MSLLEALRRLFARPTVQPITGLDPERTRLVVGLGNPGPEFADTRHNVGFRCVEELARRCGASWQDKIDALGSLVAVAHPDPDLTLVLARPQTFMNRSGKAVKELREFLKLPSARCLIVYDEMDLPLGTLRMRKRGSPGTHNGMRSVIAALGSEDVPRLRIGIGQASPGAATDHVLSEFAPEERGVADVLIASATDAVLGWAKQGAEVAMNRYNKS